jgi:hypothetical protein
MPPISQITVRPHHMYPLLSHLIGPNKATEKVHPECGGQRGRAGTAHFPATRTRNRQWSVSTIAGGDGQREVGFAATHRSPTTGDLHLRRTVERDGGLNLSTPREGLEVEEGAALPCLVFYISGRRHPHATPVRCPKFPPLTGDALLAAARAATMRLASASVH